MSSKEENKRRSKYAPSISQIMDAAKRLPHPQKAKKQQEDVFVLGENGRTISFELIKMSDSEGMKNLKWSYKGRVIVDSKFCKKLNDPDD